MTKEELKDRLVKWILDNSNLNSRDAICYSEELITLIREAGYISPSEFEEKLQEKMYQEYNGERYKP